jgi:MoaA/NifB/PqqE/SkfB family radical SAM enzyme
MYPTMACNAKCHFCYYYEQKEKTWRPKEDVLKNASDLRERFGLEAVDITGGEPTIYPEIESLVSHCSRIGLKPTVITNGLLTERIAGLIDDCGLDDVLLSVHGLNDKHNEAVGKPGAWGQVGLTIDMMLRKKFSFRTNTTLTTFCVPELDALAKFFIQIKPRMVNFINFNPYPGGTGLGWMESHSR